MKQAEIDFQFTDFSALNYVPFVLKVHYKDEAENLIKENENSKISTSDS